MTSQPIVDSPVRASDLQPQPKQAPEATAINQQRSRLIEAMKSQYQLDQQVKFLHLQAEADSLLQQLQTLKQQRQTVEASSSQR